MSNSRTIVYCPCSNPWKRHEWRKSGSIMKIKIIFKKKQEITTAKCFWISAPTCTHTHISFHLHVMDFSNTKAKVLPERVWVLLPSHQLHFSKKTPQQFFRFRMLIHSCLHFCCPVCHQFYQNQFCSAAGIWIRIAGFQHELLKKH